MLSNKQFNSRVASRRAFSRPTRPSLHAVAAAGPKTTTKAPASAAITPEVAKDLYYDMVLGREFEDM